MYFVFSEKKNIKINYKFLLAVFGIMLVGGTIAIVFFLRTNALANQKIAEATEAKRPANLDLTIITDKKCSDCFDVNTLLSQIKKQNVNVGSEKSVDKDSDEGKDLIKKFAIKLVGEG